MDRVQHSVIGSALLALVATMASSSAWASGTTLWVTNDGVDTAGCGGRAKPCRSISQAIENASAGDTIEVGAGRYGNISGDGTFSHPGDEHPQTLLAPISRSTFGCMVCIVKPLSIFSLHGASATVIEGVPGFPASRFNATVIIATTGVTFGGDGRGFTITGGNAVGVGMFQDLIFFQPVVLSRIGGNIDLGDSTGFLWQGREFEDRLCLGPLEVCAPTPAVFAGNEAVNNGTGFAVVVNDDVQGSAIVLRGNLARGDGIGFSINPGTQTLTDIVQGAGQASLLGNVAEHNGVGFKTNLGGPMIGNTALGNTQAGFSAVPGNADFRDNSAVGNSGPGLIVNFSADSQDDGSFQQRKFEPFSGNNFFGNDRNRPSLGVGGVIAGYNGGVVGSFFNPGPGAHCGILNVGALAARLQQEPFPAETLRAPGNFWGSASGPSFTGGGDAVGGPCDQNAGTTVAKPFATGDFAITSLP